MIRRSPGNVFSLVNPVRGALFGRNRIEALGALRFARPAGSISVDAAIIAGLFARCRWN